MSAPLTAGLEPLWTAKARVPLAPVVHVPRPERTALLAQALDAHRLVVLCAGGLAGKTTLLADLVRAGELRSYCWYSVDELDTSAQALLEGLALAVTGMPCGGDQTALLARIIGALDRRPDEVVLVLDDLHRSPVAGQVLDRLLRYLPPRARLLAATRPDGLSLGALGRWLAGQGQLAVFDTAALQLTPAEEARFARAAGRGAGSWPVHYRPGGEAALAEDLLSGVLPLLDPELSAPLEAPAVIGAAQVPLLAAALRLSTAEIGQRLRRLAEETILLERAEAETYRLTEAARTAVLGQPERPTLAAMRGAVAVALEGHDDAEAARLFAQADEPERAARAAARVGFVGWWRRRAPAAELEKLLPARLLPATGALALTRAITRFALHGPQAAHVLARLARPANVEDRMEQLRLLGLCSLARGRPWSAGAAARRLERLVTEPDAAITPGIRAVGLLSLASLHSQRGDLAEAATALEECLALLVLGGERDERAQGVRRQALHLLGRLRSRQGNLTAADRLYREAAAASEGPQAGQGPWLAELANNRAVLLSQQGRHQESIALLDETLASPWPAELGLRPLLLASLAEAHAALDESATAANLLRRALDEADPDDARGIAGHAHALLALILAAGSHQAAARAELAAGASPAHPATLLTRALLLAPGTPEAGRLAGAAVEAAGQDRPLRALATAYQAVLAEATGDVETARAFVGALKRDGAYPLCPREAAVLGSLARLRYRARGACVPADGHGVRLRFFGDPAAVVAGTPLGAAGWRYTASRDLFWYALAHEAAGFTRAEALADLFPDQDTTTAGRLLRNGLYGLRRLLAQTCALPDALPLAGGRLRLVPEDLGSPLVSDLAALRDRLRRLRAGELEAGMDLPRLLAGRYLAAIDDEWVLPFRTYWEREAVRALDLAAALFERAGRSQDALDSLEAELAFCPDDALLVRRVLRLCAVVGDGGALRAVYLQHCRTARELCR